MKNIKSPMKSILLLLNILLLSTASIADDPGSTEKNKSFKLLESKTFHITAIVKGIVFAGEMELELTPSSTVYDSKGNPLPFEKIKPPVSAEIEYFIVPNQNTRSIFKINILSDSQQPR